MASLTQEESARRTILLRQKQLDEVLSDWRGRSHLAPKRFMEVTSLLQREEKTLRRTAAGRAFHDHAREIANACGPKVDRVVRLDRRDRALQAGVRSVRRVEALSARRQWREAKRHWDTAARSVASISTMEREESGAAEPDVDDIDGETKARELHSRVIDAGEKLRLAGVNIDMTPLGDAPDDVSSSAARQRAAVPRHTTDTSAASTPGGFATPTSHHQDTSTPSGSGHLGLEIAGSGGGGKLGSSSASRHGGTILRGSPVPGQVGRRHPNGGPGASAGQGGNVNTGGTASTTKRGLASKGGGGRVAGPTVGAGAGSSGAQVGGSMGSPMKTHSITSGAGAGSPERERPIARNLWAGGGGGGGSGGGGGGTTANRAGHPPRSHSSLALVGNSGGNNNSGNVSSHGGGDYASAEVTDHSSMLEGILHVSSPGIHTSIGGGNSGSNVSKPFYPGQVASGTASDGALMNPGPRAQTASPSSGVVHRHSSHHPGDMSEAPSASRTASSHRSGRSRRERANSSAAGSRRAASASSMHAGDHPHSPEPAGAGGPQSALGLISAHLSHCQKDDEPDPALENALRTLERDRRDAKSQLRLALSKSHDLETAVHEKSVLLGTIAATNAAGRRVVGNRGGVSAGVAAAVGVAMERAEADAAVVYTPGVRTRDRAGAALDLSGSGVVDVSRGLPYHVETFVQPPGVDAASEFPTSASLARILAGRKFAIVPHHDCVVAVVHLGPGESKARGGSQSHEPVEITPGTGIAAFSFARDVDSDESRMLESILLSWASVVAPQVLAPVRDWHREQAFIRRVDRCLGIGGREEDADLDTSIVAPQRMPELGAALESCVDALRSHVGFDTLVMCACVEGGRRGYGLEYIATREGEIIATSGDVGINPEVHAFLAEDWQRAAGRTWDVDEDSSSAAGGEVIGGSGGPEIDMGPAWRGAPRGSPFDGGVVASVDELDEATADVLDLLGVDESFALFPIRVPSGFSNGPFGVRDRAVGFLAVARLPSPGEGSDAGDGEEEDSTAGAEAFAFNDRRGSSSKGIDALTGGGMGSGSVESQPFPVHEVTLISDLAKAISSRLALYTTEWARLRRHFSQVHTRAILRGVGISDTDHETDLHGAHPLAPRTIPCVVVDLCIDPSRLAKLLADSPLRDPVRSGRFQTEWIKTVREIAWALGGVIVSWGWGRVLALWGPPFAGHGYPAMTWPDHHARAVEFACRARVATATIHEAIPALGLATRSPIRTLAAIASGATTVGVIGAGDDGGGLVAFSSAVDTAKRLSQSVGPGSVAVTGEVCDVLSANPSVERWIGGDRYTASDPNTPGPASPMASSIGQGEENLYDDSNEYGTQRSSSPSPSPGSSGGVRYHLVSRSAPRGAFFDESAEIAHRRDRYGAIDTYEDFEPPFPDHPSAQPDGPLGATHPYEFGAASIDDAPSELLTPKRPASSQGSSAEPFRLVDMYGRDVSSQNDSSRGGTESPGEISGEWAGALPTLTINSARRRGEL